MDPNMVKQTIAELKKPMLDEVELPWIREQITQRLLTAREQATGPMKEVALPLPESEDATLQLIEDIINLLKPASTDVGVCALSIIIGIVTNAMNTSAGMGSFAVSLKKFAQDATVMAQAMQVVELVALAKGEDPQEYRRAMSARGKEIIAASRQQHQKKD